MHVYLKKPLSKQDVEQMGHTIMSMAELMGVHHHTLAKIYKVNSRFQFLVARDIARYLGVPMNTMFSIEEVKDYVK